MKLVVYDDLPSPNLEHQHRHSLSSWFAEGKTFASRASTGANFSRKRHSTTPLKIGAPTDFRRVQSFQPPPHFSGPYEPLELSIHRSGHRLSNLPSFESFQLGENQQRLTLAVPPRALSQNGIRARRCLSSDPSVSLSRKPVGSGNRRSVGRSQDVVEPPPRVQTASTLIPHFSVVSPVETTLSVDGSLPMFLHTRAQSQESIVTLSMDWSSQGSGTGDSMEAELRRQAPIMTKDERHQDEPSNGSANFDHSPSSASSRTMPSRISSLRRPSTTENRKTIASIPLANQTSQWFPPKENPLPRKVSLAGENGFAWERTRTLSGSTVASTVTTITGDTKVRGHNASISSTLTNTMTLHTSSRSPSPAFDEEFEAGYSQPVISEGRPQHSFSSPQYNDPAIGVAF